MTKNLFFALSMYLCLVWGRSAHAQLVVIANPSVKAMEISKSELRDVFTGSSSTVGGTHVTPVLQSGSLQDEFLNHYIGKSSTAFRATWRGLVFSGQNAMPHTLDSDAAVVEYVAHTPGAIGYIERSTPHDGVKTLAVK